MRPNFTSGRRRRALFAKLFFLAFLGMTMKPTGAQTFFEVRDGQFVRDGQPFYFLGTNFWYGLNLAAPGAAGDRIRLLQELDHLQQLGIRNLRIMAASEGPDTAPWRMVPALQTAPGAYNESLLEGLDFLLVEMAKRDMSAVLCLNNMWPWSGGMAQYLSWVTGEPIPYPPPAEGGNWVKYIAFVGRFFKNKDAIALSHQHIRKIVNRRNSLTGVLYKNDPAIFAWQLANEPRPLWGLCAYRRWVRQTADLIKALDPHHLVSVGSEGNAFLPLSRKFKKEHRSKNIDYTTCHIWVENWHWYDPTGTEKDFEKALGKAKKYLRDHLKMAQKLNKPLVLEEFGLARDNRACHPDATTRRRDRYFEEIFEQVWAGSFENPALAGCNFWAWAGAGRPRTPSGIWQPGDDFTGDPPFEIQGWYSVFNTDRSTLNVIRTFARKMNQRMRD